MMPIDFDRGLLLLGIVAFRQGFSQFLMDMLMFVIVCCFAV